MRKPHYVPIKEVPIFFFLESYSKTVGHVNGFEIIRVSFPVGYQLYLQLGKHVWVRV